jgi:hypothetical protein
MRGRGAWFRLAGGFLTDSGPAATRASGAAVARTGEFFIYSNKIQTNWNCFDQKMELLSSKNSK